MESALDVKILYVCTANICRSPSAEYLMRDAVLALGIPDVVVGSAGVQPLKGAVGCELAPALHGRNSTHRSKALTEQPIQWADLILTAGREHQAAVTECSPEARTKMHTLLQSGRIAAWLQWQGMVEAGRGRAAVGQQWQTRFAPDDPRGAVSPLLEDRDGWLVEEMDAARGLVPIPASHNTKRGAAPDHVDDIPDPHTGDATLHPMNYRQIWDATNALATLLQAASQSVGARVQ